MDVNISLFIKFEEFTKRLIDRFQNTSDFKMQLNKDKTRQHVSLNKYVACNRPRISFDASLILVCAIRCEIDSARDYVHGQIVTRKLP